MLPILRKGRTTVEWAWWHHRNATISKLAPGQGPQNFLHRAPKLLRPPLTTAMVLRKEISCFENLHVVYCRGSQPGVHVLLGLHLSVWRGAFKVNNRR